MTDTQASGNTPAASQTSRPGWIAVTVSDTGGVVKDGQISLFLADVKQPKQFKAAEWTVDEIPPIKTQLTDDKGYTIFSDLQPGCYVLEFDHYPEIPPKCVPVHSGCVTDECFDIGLHANVEIIFQTPDCQPTTCPYPRVGDTVHVKFVYDYSDTSKQQVTPVPPQGFIQVPDTDNEFVAVIDTSGRQEGFQPQLKLGLRPGRARSPEGDAFLLMTPFPPFDAVPMAFTPVSGNIGVTLQRTATTFTDDMAFFQGILNKTEVLSFNHYLRFMNGFFCDENGLSDLPEFEQERFQKKGVQLRILRKKRFLPFTDADAYRVLKAATEAFVMVNCGVLAQPRPFDREGDKNSLARRDLPVPTGGLEHILEDKYLVNLIGGAQNAKTLPYLAVIRAKLRDIPIGPIGPRFDPEAVSLCYGILQEKLTNPCLLELIWSYWHEEGMLVQTINAITRRFQNVRGPMAHDPLANLAIDPLRPLNNLIWGYLQDEQHRLSVLRRNSEYDSQYGLRLEGRAIQDLRPADSRSKFLEAFHNLLRLCSVFYKQDDDTTVKADAFPVLNALKEVHLILSQGAHNQFGDLPSTARIEMLMQQWLLARPEFREFLPTRIMVAYPEPWMDRADAMKRLQGWTDTSVLHFRNLAIFGEKVLLTIRWGLWSDVQEPLQAFNWARLLRPYIQGYSHAYWSATGVDLSAETVGAKVDATLPSVMLKQRLAVQRQRMA